MAILLLTNVRWDVTLKECQGFFPSALNKQKKGAREGVIFKNYQISAELSVAYPGGGVSCREAGESIHNPGHTRTFPVTF